MTKTRVKGHPRRGTKGVKKHSRTVPSKKTVPHIVEPMGMTIARKLKYYEREQEELLNESYKHDELISELEDDLLDAKNELDDLDKLSEGLSYPHHKVIEYDEQKKVVDELKEKIQALESNRDSLKQKANAFNKKHNNLVYKPLIELPKLSTRIEKSKEELEGFRYSLKLAKEYDNYSDQLSASKSFKQEKVKLERLKKRKRKLEAVIREVRKAGY